MKRVFPSCVQFWEGHLTPKMTEKWPQQTTSEKGCNIRQDVQTSGGKLSIVSTKSIDGSPLMHADCLTAIRPSEFTMQKQISEECTVTVLEIPKKLLE